MSYENNINHDYDIGDGKMEYIQDIHMRELLTDAWKAITLTNNWDFIYEDISRFAFENEPRNYEILQKMSQIKPCYLKQSHKYYYRVLMRCMNYLARNGEKKFEMFINKLSV
jgi:hypothetical protein